MIERSYYWIIVLFLVIGTFAIRASLIAASSRVKISDRAKEVFTYIPAAILPAFIAPFAFYHVGQSDFLAGKERLLAMMLSTVICLWTRSTVATICFGLAVLYVMTQYVA